MMGIFVIVMLLLMMVCSLYGMYKLLEELNGEIHRMISKAEYKMLESLLDYKEKSNKVKSNEWVLLTEDFNKFCKRKSYMINTILKSLHEKGYILDTAYLNNSSAHSVKITNEGMTEFLYYHSERMKKIAFWLIPIVVSATVSAVISVVVTILSNTIITAIR